MSGFRSSSKRKISDALCSPVSGDEKPPKRARICGIAPSERFLVMAVAFVRPTRSAARGILLALGAAVVAAAGCGGGGEAHIGDGGPPDLPIVIDSGNPDVPLKQIGEACAAGAECGSKQCVEGVCCNTACDQACFTCKNPGS